MKIVNDKGSGITPYAGCVCSEGRDKTRGLWDPVFNCNCQCSYGNDNDASNDKKADVK